MGTTAADLRIVRAAAGPAEIVVEGLGGAAVAVADAGAAAADRAAIAVDVLGANFPPRSMHLHGRSRSIRASRERPKGTSRRCCRENR